MTLTLKQQTLVPTKRSNRTYCSYITKLFESIFANRIISHGIWPDRSPDLTPLDYYLWRALKRRVYENNSHNLEELKTAIIQCIQQITPDILRDVLNNMQRRVQKYLNVNGGHFRHFL